MRYGDSDAFHSPCFTEADVNINEIPIFFKANQILKHEGPGRTKTYLFYSFKAVHVTILLRKTSLRLKMTEKVRLKRIIKEHKDFIFTYAYYFTGTREDAEDMTQEVLLKIWQNMDMVRKGITRSWISTVTRNVCIDWARRRGARPDMTTSGEPEELDRLPSLSMGQSGAERAELRKHLKAAIARLPEKIRSTIILREIEGWKYEEIGEMLNMPLNSVKSYIHRGRRMLREQLSHLYQDELCGR
jgi:RNA polymerase sigma factor (sigma-70 family)